MQTHLLGMAVAHFPTADATDSASSWRRPTLRFTCGRDLTMITVTTLSVRLAVLTCALSVCAAVTARAEPIVPLTPAQEATFWGSAQDAAPEVRNTFKAENAGQHFLYCDELRLDLFEPQLRNLGGGYVGVGSDQAYLFIGWVRPQLAWLTDYDDMVVRLHRIYHAFFAEATTSAQFLTLWREPAKGVAVLEKRLAGDAELSRLVRMYKVQRPYVMRRLSFIQWRAGKAKLQTYLNNAEEYTFVRDLIAAKRVRPMLGNLLADKGFKGVSEASRALGVAVRALYVSNAEQYWPYSTGYRNNVRGMNFDGKSWIVRTLASKPANGDYRYFLQAASRFVAELSDPKVKGVGQVAPIVGIQDRNMIPLVTVEADGKRHTRWADDYDKVLKKLKAEGKWHPPTEAAKAAP